MSNTRRAVRSVAGAAVEIETARAPQQARIITLPAPARAVPERPSKLKAFCALLAVGLAIAAAVSAASTVARLLLLS